MDKKSLITGLLIGIIIGTVVSGILIMLGLTEIAGSIQIQTLTINIPFNQTSFEEHLIKATVR